MTNREAINAMTNWELALWITERIQTAFYWGETPDADAEYKWLNEEAGCFGCRFMRDGGRPEWCHSEHNVCLIRDGRRNT